MDRYEKMTDEQLIQKLRDGDNRIVDYIKILCEKKRMLCIFLEEKMKI